MNAYTDEEIEVFRIEAEFKERRRIIDWLRSANARGSEWIVEATLADAIERGDHLK